MNRPLPGLLAAVLLALLALTTVAATPAQTGTSIAALMRSADAETTSAGSGYRQVVDLTFPVDSDARYFSGPYSYFNDYDQPRPIASPHRATDIMVDTGTPVYAVVDGVIERVTGMGCAGARYGALDQPRNQHFYAILRGDDGRAYWYLHLGRNTGSAEEAYAPGITCGVRVQRGQHLGYAGYSGNASPSSPHLHLEIHDAAVRDPYGSNRINPFYSLKAAEERGDFPDGDGPSLPAPEPEDPFEFEDEITRIAGENRIETAARLANEYWPDGADEVVIATSRNHADAVAGTALAISRDAPLLLAEPGAIPAATRAALEDLAPQEVWLLGGSAALGDAVADTIRSEFGATVNRRAGANRYATAAGISSYVNHNGTVALAPGHGAGGQEAWPAGVLAGALSAGDAAVPLLLTDRDGLPPETRQALVNLNPSEVLVLGEDGAVPASVDDALDDLGMNATRLTGEDRYELAAAVLGERAGGGGPLLLVSGGDFPDALAAGAAAGRADATVTLVPPRDLDEAGSAFTRAIGGGGYDPVIAVGGVQAIAGRVVVDIQDLLGL